MKLHLGCGKRRFPGYVHVDIRQEINPEVIDDVFKLEKFENDSAEIIYNSHVLEHVDRQGSYEALKRWYDVLKPGGILRVSVPDMEAVFEHYVYHRDLKILYAFLWGSQKYEKYDYHYHGWDFKTLKEAMEMTGFKDVQLWDWRETYPNNEIDDYSRAYLPHMDFEKGRLMSLNMQGTK
jgi:predicted SAM-dependent methyltransferase